MTTPHRLALATAFGLAGLCAAASCAPKQPGKPDATVTTRGAGNGATSQFTYRAGEAGGTWEDTVTGVATVAEVDQGARTVTLVDAGGTRATFRASPEVRNFDRIRAGDRVNVTVGERVRVFVDRGGEGGTARAASAGLLAARAPKGAKPGGIVAESFEVAATVAAIDPAARTATLRFADGDTMKIPVREDVELARYKVGDTVVIQVTQHLTVLVATP